MSIDCEGELCVFYAPASDEAGAVSIGFVGASISPRMDALRAGTGRQQGGAKMCHGDQSGFCPHFRPYTRARQKAVRATRETILASHTPATPILSG